MTQNERKLRHALGILIDVLEAQRIPVLTEIYMSPRVRHAMKDHITNARKVYDDTKPPYLEIGCHFAKGIYIGQAVQELAVEHGWSGQPLTPTDEHYYDAMQEAEEYLEDFLSPYTYCGNNESGDWGVWPIFNADDLPRWCGEVPHTFTGDAYQVNDHDNVICGRWVDGELKETYWEVV